MNSHPGNDQQSSPQAVEVESRLLDDIVGAGSETVSFTTYQDRLSKEIAYHDASAAHGLESPQAIEAKASLDDVIARLHPMDR